MSPLQSWQEHFKDRLQGQPPSLSIEDALSQGLILEAEYLLWARDFYELPTVDLSFFTSKQAPTAAFWDKWKTKFIWSSHCLPLAEWEGHLVVASVERIEELPPHLSAIQVLTTPAPLHELWARWNVSTLPALSTPEPSFDLTQGFPEALSLDDVDSSEPQTVSEKHDGELELGESSEGPMMPEGLTGPISVTVSLFKPNTIAELESVQSPLMPQETKKPEAISPPAPVPASAPAPSPAPVIEKPLHWLAKLRSKNPKVFDELCYSLFSQLKAFFDHSILFSYDMQDMTLRPLLWDPSFSIENEPATYSLEGPSFLRIVKNSEKSFHGSPSLNEFNEKFFQDWHSGQIPDHLTVVPVIVGDRLIGMVYCSGRKSAYTSQALSFTESKVANILTGILSKLANQAA